MAKNKGVNKKHNQMLTKCTILETFGGLWGSQYLKLKLLLSNTLWFMIMAVIFSCVLCELFKYKRFRLCAKQ